MEPLDQRETEHFDAQRKLSRMTHYHAWALSFLGAYCGDHIWDAGAGVGLLAETLLKRNPAHLLLTEFTERNLAQLRDQYGDRANVSIQFCDLNKTTRAELTPEHIDTVIMLDVLEHVPDDDAALSLIHDALDPAGRLLIKVPAHPFLFCSIDKVSLHYRRYTKAMLKQRLEKAGFTIRTLRYMNMPGAVLYFFKGKFGKHDTNYSRTIPDKRLDLMNKAIPLIRFIERIIPPPFGLSVVAVAEKKA